MLRLINLEGGGGGGGGGGGASTFLRLAARAPTVFLVKDLLAIKLGVVLHVHKIAPD